MTDEANTPQTSNPLADFVKRLKAEQEAWKSPQWESIPVPPDPPRPQHHRIEWRLPDSHVAEPTVSIEAARSILETEMLAYIDTKHPKETMLVRAQPGVGKTHAAIHIAQAAAKKGLRVLYAMPQHRHWETLENMPHFDYEYWYHWLALDATSPATGNTMCIYTEAMHKWTSKGYPAMKLCDSMCAFYKDKCEYRRQNQRKESIIAGVHDHVATGMSISDFDLAIIDELPVRAFLRPRYIPRDGIAIDGVGPVQDLAEILKTYPIDGPHKSIQGRELFAILEPYMDDVYAQFEDYKSAIPVIPWISKPADVDRASYWYLPDFLILAVRELKAYRDNQPEWLERIILTDKHLIMLERSEPWNKLPSHVIALDATGNAAAYEQLLGRKVRVVSPSVMRKGNVYQVTYRLNGISTTLKKSKGGTKLNEDGKEALKLCQAIIEERGYKNPGAVTFKNAVPEFEEFFGAGKVLNFFGQRGSNDLVDVDGLFVVGCPQPNDTEIMQQVKILYPDRMRPFGVVERDGLPVPARSDTERRYRYYRPADGRQAARMISGFWNDPDLETIAAIYREEELLQAIHRARPISREADVWLLTSIPTNEPLTDIFDMPADLLDSPIPNWFAWRKIRMAMDDAYTNGQVITYEWLAEVSKLPIKSLQRQKLLTLIGEKYSEFWQPALVPAKGKGRPARCLGVRHNDTTLDDIM